MNNYASIINFEQFDEVRGSIGRIVCTSGGFDPLHPGHASCLIESKKFGDALVVVVNGDSFLRRKKGKPFMDVQTRCNVVSCITGVDYVIPFEIEEDQTVCEALRRIKPHVFTKGGDRTDYSNIPEWAVCQELGIELIPQVGKAKLWSSSDFLRDWGDYAVKKAGLFAERSNEQIEYPHVPPFEQEPRVFWSRVLAGNNQAGDVSPSLNG